MWTELIGTLTGGTLLAGGYYGLYKLGWYMSKKEQETLIKYKIKHIEELNELHDGLQEYKENLINHLEKLNNHKVEWKKNK